MAEEAGPELAARVAFPAAFGWLGSHLPGGAGGREHQGPAVGWVADSSPAADAEEEARAAGTGHPDSASSTASAGGREAGFGGRAGGDLGAGPGRGRAEAFQARGPSGARAPLATRRLPRPPPRIGNPASNPAPRHGAPPPVPPRPAPRRV